MKEGFITPPEQTAYHRYNHMFIVVKGEAKVLLGDQTVIIRRDESFLVKGEIPHSVWNNSDGETVMIGISVD